MNPTNQASWPSAYEDYMSDKHMPFPPLRFWQEAYLAAHRAGQSTTYCLAAADSAQRNLAKHTHLVYGQTEGSAARDEVAGCLRGAVTAMEELRRRALLEGAIERLYPGLPDLIARSKKALGDA